MEEWALNLDAGKPEFASCLRHLNKDSKIQLSRWQFYDFWKVQVSWLSYKATSETFAGVAGLQQE